MKLNQLNDDSLLYIFNQLSVIDLLRYKSICTKWNSLLKYITSHKNHMSIVCHTSYYYRRKKLCKGNFISLPKSNKETSFYPYTDPFTCLPIFSMTIKTSKLIVDKFQHLKTFEYFHTNLFSHELALILPALLSLKTLNIYIIQTKNRPDNTSKWNYLFAHLINCYSLRSLSVNDANNKFISATFDAIIIISPVCMLSNLFWLEELFYHLPFNMSTVGQLAQHIGQWPNLRKLSMPFASQFGLQPDSYMYNVLFNMPPSNILQHLKLFKPFEYSPYSQLTNRLCDNFKNLTYLYLETFVYIQMIFAYYGLIELENLSHLCIKNQTPTFPICRRLMPKPKIVLPWRMILTEVQHKQYRSLQRLDLSYMVHREKEHFGLWEQKHFPILNQINIYSPPQLFKCDKCAKDASNEKCVDKFINSLNVIKSLRKVNYLGNQMPRPNKK